MFVCVCVCVCVCMFVQVCVCVCVCVCARLLFDRYGSYMCARARVCDGCIFKCVSYCHRDRMAYGS